MSDPRQQLGFLAPAPNALDAVGDRDVLLDLVDACMRAVVTASRPSEELVLWATPAFGYVRLDDAASTGSSLMPQKRNPDPFELVRGAAGALIGAHAGAVATVKGVALSYHRDLQQTKSRGRSRRRLTRWPRSTRSAARSRTCAFNAPR